MKYENIDETNKYQEACRKVKQIANAIKLIRIKYYPNFARISDEDKQIHDELNTQIEKIAKENGLEKLKAELIEDISDRYALNSDEEIHDSSQLEDKNLKAYYGAIDAGEKALSEGKLKKARSCQKEADIYWAKLEKLDQKNGTNKLIEMATDYKRAKFAELVPTKEEITTQWNQFMEACHRDESEQDRREFIDDAERNITEKPKEKETVVSSTDDKTL